MRLSHILPSVGFVLFLAGSAMAQSAGDCEVTAEGMFTGLLAATKQSAQVCADERTKQQGGPSASPAPSNASADRPFDAGEQAAINAVVECAKKKPDEVVALVRNTARTNGGNIPAAIESQRKSYCRAPVNSIVQENNNGAFATGGAVGPISVGSSSQSGANALAAADAKAQALAEQTAILQSLNQTRSEVGPLMFDLWYYRESALAPHMSWFHINQALGFTYGDNAVFKRPSWGLKVTQQLGVRFPKTPFVVHAVGALTLPIANGDTAKDALRDWGITVGGRLTWHALRNRDLALFPTLGYDYDAYQGNRVAPHKVVVGADVLFGGWRFRHKFGVKIEASCPITADLAHPHCEGYFAVLLPSQGTNH